MALSGVNNITLDSRGQVKSMIEWSATQSINNNSSTITVKVYSYFQYAIYASAAADVIVNIAGQSQTVSRVIGSHPNGVKKLVATVTKTVSHNSEGRLTARIRVTNPFKVTYSGQYINQANHDFNITLDTIDRESSVSVPASVTIPNSKPSVTITPKNSAFRHIADLEIGGRKIMTLNNLAGGTHTFNLSTAQENEILNIMKNTTSMEYSVVISTWNGNTRIGGYPRAKGTFKVDEMLIPNIKSITITDNNTDVKNKIGVFVYGKSRLKVDTSASGVRGSTISSIRVTFLNKVYNGSSILTDVIGTDGLDIPVLISVVDSRGRAHNTSRYINVYKYYSPIIKIDKIVRAISVGPPSWDLIEDPEGDSIMLDGFARAFSISGGADRKGRFTIEMNAEGSSLWDTIVDMAYSPAFGDIDLYRLIDPTYSFNLTYSYNIRLTLYDGVETTVVVGKLPSGFTILDFRSTGKGVAIGKVSEKDAFEVAMDAEFSGKVQSKDAITVFAPTENATDNVLQRFRRKDGTTHSVFMYNETDQALYLHLFSRTRWKTWFTFKDDGTILAGGKSVDFSVAEPIGNNSNLNDFKEGGSRYVLSNTNAGTIMNTPVASTAFLLEVINFRGNVKQTFTAYNNSAMYTRTYYAYGNSWSAWKKIY